MFDLAQINVWGTIAAAFATFALGAVWFSPVLFMKSWSESLAKNPKDMGSPVVAMGLTLVTTIVTAFALALLFQAGDIDTTGRGLLAGAIVGLGIAATSSLSDALFVGQVKRWWVIQVGFRIVGFIVMGAIIGASAPESHLRAMERKMEKAGVALPVPGTDSSSHAKDSVAQKP